MAEIGMAHGLDAEWIECYRNIVGANGTSARLIIWLDPVGDFFAEKIINGNSETMQIMADNTKIAINKSIGYALGISPSKINNKGFNYKSHLQNEQD